MFKCKKCGSKSYELRPKGTATGLYCADCGFWHKWVAKEELYRYQGLQKANIRSGGNMTNRQWLESLSDEEYAKFLSIVMRYGTDFVCDGLVKIYTTATNEMEYDYANENLYWLKSSRPKQFKRLGGD